MFDNFVGLALKGLNLVPRLHKNQFLIHSYTPGWCERFNLKKFMIIRHVNPDFAHGFVQTIFYGHYVVRIKLL